MSAWHSKVSVVSHYLEFYKRAYLYGPVLQLYFRHLGAYIGSHSSIWPCIAPHF
jgi:hypothetical protein